MWAGLGPQERRIASQHHLLASAQVVGTPGSGFGPSGEHYFRLTAFGTYEKSVEAMERIRRL